MEIFHTGVIYPNNVNKQKIQQKQNSIKVSSSLLSSDKLEKNSKNVSFKSNWNFLALFSNEKNNDTFLTRGEATQELTEISNKLRDKQTIKNYLNFIKSDKGYSKNRIEAIKELNKCSLLTSSETIDLIKICIDGKGLNKNIFNDIKKLLKCGFQSNDIKRLMAECIHRDLFKCKITDYESQAIKDVLSASEEIKKNIKPYIQASINKKNKYVSNLGQRFIKENKNKLLTIHDIKNLSFLSSITEDKLRNKVMDKSLELMNQGFSSNNVRDILNPIPFDDLIQKDKLLNSLLKDLPDIKDKDELTKFIRNRILLFKQASQGEYNEKLFHTYNYLYEKIHPKYTEDFDLMMNIIKNYTPHTEKEFLEESLNFLNIKDIAKSCEIMNKYCAHDEIIDLFHALNPKDKKDFIKIIEDLSKNQKVTKNNKDIIKIYTELYQINPKEHLHSELSEIASKCISDTCHTKFGLATLTNYARVEYAKKHINDKDLLFYMDLISFNLDNIINKHSGEQYDYSSVENAKKMLQGGFDKGIFSNNYNNKHMAVQIINHNLKTEQALKLKKQGISTDYALLLASNLLSEDELKNLINIRNEAIKRRDELTTAGGELKDEDIDDIFFYDHKRTIQAISSVGQDTIVQTFKEKTDNVKEYIELFSFDVDDITEYEFNFNAEKQYAKFVEIINPTNSQSYINYDNIVKTNKKRLSKENNPEIRKKIIKDITEASKARNTILNNSIKDPQQKLEAAIIFYSILSEYNSDIEYLNQEYFYDHMDDLLNALDKILPYMNYKTPEEKEKFYELLHDTIFETLGINKPSDKTINKLNLKNNKYLPKLFNLDEDAKENFIDIVELLEQNPNKTNLEIFNSLERNVETKKQFEKLGINYDKWVEYNPDSKIIVKIKTDTEKHRQNALKNLEADLNDEFFSKIPSEETRKIFDALKKAGFDIVETEEAKYIDDGVFAGKQKVKKLYKDNMPIRFDDLANIIKVLKAEMNKNEFWNTKNVTSEIETAKETIKNHILKLRHNEIKTVNKHKSEESSNIVIQKADMNDISSSLFLGNYASCCTAIGSGCNQWTAPNYIKNKLVSCIEIKNDDTPIGNTMIYLAKINGKPSLLLDNIEMKAQYQYNDAIRDAIIEYAQIITQDIGYPNMPIYAGANRHKVNLDKFPIVNANIEIIGSTGDDEIYLDFASKESANKIYQESLYKIK